MSILRWCNDVCRALYYRASRNNKPLQRFAVVACAQSRCGFCGESVDKRKRIKLVEC